MKRLITLSVFTCEASTQAVYKSL